MWFSKIEVRGCSVKLELGVRVWFGEAELDGEGIVC